MGTVSHLGNEEEQRRKMANDRERRVMQRYEFCNQIWEGIYNQVARQIQVLWQYVHQDTVARLNNLCLNSHGELEVQLGGIGCSRRDGSGGAKTCKFRR